MNTRASTPQGSQSDLHRERKPRLARYNTRRAPPTHKEANVTELARRIVLTTATKDETLHTSCASDMKKPIVLQRSLSRYRSHRTKAEGYENTDAPPLPSQSSMRQHDTSLLEKRSNIASVTDLVQAAPIQVRDKVSNPSPARYLCNIHIGESTVLEPLHQIPQAYSQEVKIDKSQPYRGLPKRDDHIMEANEHSILQQDGYHSSDMPESLESVMLLRKHKSPSTMHEKTTLDTTRILKMEVEHQRRLYSELPQRLQQHDPLLQTSELETVQMMKQQDCQAPSQIQRLETPKCDLLKSNNGYKTTEHKIDCEEKISRSMLLHDKRHRPRETGSLPIDSFPASRVASSRDRKDRLVTEVAKRSTTQNGASAPLNTKPMCIPGPQALRSGTAPKQLNHTEHNINAGRVGLVPGIDAPISAVNAGDRRVLVACNSSSILLPVTLNTTPVDLLRSASICLSETIDAKTSTLLEEFGKVGVQRPLRFYEHVRDVMNSWDDDKQNTLVIVSSKTGIDDHELDDAAVPLAQPHSMSCYFYHSQKPGKWDKKWVTLKEDGQITVAKSETSTALTNICHLSDFDIYTPCQSALGCRIEAPKKFVFAVKSQQKSNMFMSAENFVHFFATADKSDAAKWYRALWGWRSWYLVNIMGEGRKGNSSQERNNNPARRHQSKQSSGSHYQLGSFQPLLDIGAFSSAPEGSGKEQTPVHSMPDKPPSTDRLPQSSRLRSTSIATVTQSNRTHPLNQGSAPFDDRTFASDGLLGHTYSERQQALQNLEKDDEAKEPFTRSGLLLNEQQKAKNVSSRRDLTESNKTSHLVSATIDVDGVVNKSLQEGRPVRAPHSSQRGSSSREALLARATSKPNTCVAQDRRPWQMSGTGDDNLIDSLFSSDNRLGVHNHDGTQQLSDRPRASAYNGPLLDLSEKKLYAPGSLLASN